MRAMAVRIAPASGIDKPAWSGMLGSAASVAHADGGESALAFRQACKKRVKPRITLRAGMGTPTVCVLAPKFRPQ
jgi:hypothetical protein